MTPEIWPQLRRLFEEALDASSFERRCILEAAGDGELRRELEELLSAAEAAGPFLESPQPNLPSLEVDLRGRRLGPYLLQGRIGKGGMSVVYAAIRDDGAYRQMVAVKLLPRSMESRDWRRRFAAERQILADLQHPDIARLLDGGTTEDGLSYAVMELVEGEPVDIHCANLDIEQRLRLFRRICRAVLFAHHNLVVHRDIKPSNILVTAAGEPKLLDFGIAKLLEPETGGRAEVTVTSGRMLTPAYASPEQLKGEPVSTASDVYSLGVLLYRLLCGSLPFEPGGISGAELQRLQRETVPEAPSMRVTSKSLSRRFRGDLDAIVLKALRCDSVRRYPSVEALLDDLIRHRDGLPVGARRGSLTYRAIKLLRRHRIAASIAFGLAILILSSSLATTLQAQRVIRERDRVRLERQEKQEVFGFLLNLFHEANPDHAREASLDVTELLDRGATQLENTLAEHPELRAPLVGVLAQVNHQVGRYEASRQLRKEEIHLLRQTGGDPTKLVPALTSLGHTLTLMNRLSPARWAYEEALSQGRSLSGPLTTDLEEELAGARAGLGVVRLQGGRPEEAKAFLESAIETFRLRLKPDDPRLTDALFNRAVAEREAGRWASAEETLREALALERHRWGNASHPRLGSTLRELSRVLAARGALEEARETGEEALTMLRETLPPDHPKIAFSLAQLGSLAQEREHLEEAEAYFREALAFEGPPFGPRDADRASLLNNLGTVLRRKGMLKSAEEATAEAIEIFRLRFPQGHPNLVAALSNLGLCKAMRGETDTARDLYRQALAMGRRALGESHPALAHTLLRWGELEEREGHHEVAASLTSEAFELRRKALGEDHPLTATAAKALAVSRRE